MAKPVNCPSCGSDRIHYHKDGQFDGEEVWFCDDCQHTWDTMPY